MKTCRGVFHVLLCGRQITVVATVKPSIESLPINVTGSAVRESSKRSLRGVGDRFSAIGCLNVSQFQRISGVRAVEGDEKKKKKLPNLSEVPCWEWREYCRQLPRKANCNKWLIQVTAGWVNACVLNTWLHVVFSQKRLSSFRWPLRCSGLWSISTFKRLLLFSSNSWQLISESPLPLHQ